MIHVDLCINELNSFGLNDFIGQDITGRNKWPYKTKIGPWGLVGGAHLGGVGGVKALLVNGKDRSDIYGTYVSDYIAKFSMLVDGNEGKKILNNNLYAALPLFIVAGLVGGAFYLLRG